MTTQSNILPYEATHPGTLIKDELEARDDMKQKDLAKELGVKATFLNEIIKGKRPVTADIAILLEKSLEVPADYWMKFQSQYEIDKARIKEKNIVKLKNIEIWKVFKKYVPVNYFQKHGYLQNDLNYDISKIEEIYDIKGVDELVDVYAQNSHTFYRKSTKLKVDEKNVFAWSSLAAYEARKQTVNTFMFENILQLCNELNKIFFENNNTIKKVEAILKQYGVKMIILNKLDKTPIDGFSFWSGNNPAIALTLRYNRIDNFAFTLLHEIAHIDLHLRNSREQQFIDFNERQGSSTIEEEADLYAQQKIISQECWNELRNHIAQLNDDLVFRLSKKYNVHPAILLGRAAFETNRYARKTKIDRSIN